MADERAEFAALVYDAYRALAEVRCHRLCEPGVGGLQADLLMVAGVDREEMMLAVHPGWPAPRDDVDAGRAMPDRELVKEYGNACARCGVNASGLVFAATGAADRARASELRGELLRRLGRAAVPPEPADAPDRA